MRAAVLHETGKPLVVEDVEVAAPQAGEVVVRIAASGMYLAFAWPRWTNGFALRPRQLTQLGGSVGRVRAMPQSHRWCR